uniref:L1 transposable element RRM domain-containing protein n=1 Tax=Latimeria chalumnae TaxID=7897 RepID=H3AP84_LATCH
LLTHQHNPSKSGVIGGVNHSSLAELPGAEMAKLVELMQGMAEDVATIRSDIAEIREENLAHQTRLMGEMWDKIQDLENRSRRNNIRVLGIPEGIEGNGVSGPALLLTVLRDCLPLESADAIEVERAHRTLGPRPPPDQRPRPIIARFLRFQDRERILRLAREAGELRWRGRSIMIFPDMSRELAVQRKLFMPERHCCMALGLRYALQYPATLRVTIAGKQQRFDDPEEAIQEL